MMRNDLPGGIPPEIAENLKEYLPEFGDLNYEEVLQHQESVYRSFEVYNKNKEKSSHNCESSDHSQLSGQEGESSRRGSFDSQLALDEAVARALQDLEDHFGDSSISHSDSAAIGNREVRSGETSTMTENHTVEQDDVDPDNMTYEQLQSLGETVGSENKGLSEELISRLPNSKYKTGFLSKRKEKQECVICYMLYKNNDKLTTLPCTHRYHSKCIKKWLQLNKTCPVCLTEVSGD